MSFITKTASTISIQIVNKMKKKIRNLSNNKMLNLKQIKIVKKNFDECIQPYFFFYRC